MEEGQESVLEAVKTLLKQCDKTQVGGGEMCDWFDGFGWWRSCKLVLIILSSALNVSGHASVQCPQLQKLSGVFNVVIQKAWVSAEGWSPQY